MQMVFRTVYITEVFCRQINTSGQTEKKQTFTEKSIPKDTKLASESSLKAKLVNIESLSRVAVQPHLLGCGLAAILATDTGGYRT